MRNKFLWRSFISFGLVFISFFVIISGIVLYLAPAGRIAHWTNWRLLGLLKDDWQAFHTIFSCAFVILSIFHLFILNWKAFWSYLKSKSKKGINRKKELLFSVIMILILFLGTFFKIPPFSSIMDYSETLAGSWEEKEKAPPIPHAENLNITQLAELMTDLTEMQILNRLSNNNIKVDNMEQTLTEIGKKNNKSPSELYEIIIKYSTSNPGRGIGRKTLEAVSNELDKDVGIVIDLLKQKGIAVTKNQTLREIAEENDRKPVEIYQLIEGLKKGDIE